MTHQEIVEFERMRPEEVVAARERGAVVFLPVAPLEWHGPHLPLGTDGLIAHHVAVRAARETGGAVLPTMFVGTDSLRPRGREPQGLGALGITDDAPVVGMDFPGFPVKSLYYHETVLGTVVREAVRVLKREPWALIVLVNGHGGPSHKRMLERIAQEETVPSTAEVLYAQSWVQDEGFDPGHADRFEASIVMALETDLVHVDRLPARDAPLVYRDFGVVNGAAFDGRPNEGFAVPDRADPRLSSPEEGQALVDASVSALVDLVTNRMAVAAGAAAPASREPRAASGTTGGKTEGDDPQHGVDTLPVEFERMSPEEVVAARKRGEVVFLPVGPLEWHGPHLPLGTDGLAPHHTAVLAARETGGVVLPPMFIGTDSLRPPGREPQGLAALGINEDVRVLGMDLPGFPVKSLYYHETVLGAVIRETVRLLKREWALIVLVNGHGGPNHRRMLERIAQEETGPSNEVLYTPSSVPDSRLDPGHADRTEASRMMALERDLVRVDRLPARDAPLVYREFGVVNGAAFDGHPCEGFAVPDNADPRLSSPEEGEALVDASVRALVDLVTNRLAAAAGTAADASREPQG
jgi:creatinine amidohydrolase